jgi:predicted unusual protein kinase regulating ubiquinone biosynthesis (AarF/ABC1/UbiB family)
MLKLSREKGMMDALGSDSAAKIVWLTPEGMIMEKFNGLDLDAVLKLHINNGMGASETEICEEIGVAVVASLKALYNEKIYHCDLHTKNIMIANAAAAGAYKAIVIDFEFGMVESEFFADAQKGKAYFPFLHICDILSVVTSCIVAGYTPTAVVEYLKENVEREEKRYEAKKTQQLGWTVQRAIKSAIDETRSAKVISQAIKYMTLETFCKKNYVEMLANPPHHEKANMFYESHTAEVFKDWMLKHFAPAIVDKILYKHTPTKIQKK